MDWTGGDVTNCGFGCGLNDGDSMIDDGRARPSARRSVESFVWVENGACPMPLGC